MPMDLHNNAKPVQTLAPQVVLGAAGDVNGALADNQGFNSLEHYVNVGATGDTLSGSIKFDFVLEHGDLSNGSDQAPVTDQFNANGTIDGAGIFATVDDNGEASNVFKVGYTGPKRFSRVVTRKTGTHTNGTPIGVMSLQGHPDRTPVT